MTVIRLDGDAFGRRIGIHVVLLLSLSDGAAVKEEEGRNKLAANTIIKLSQFFWGFHKNSEVSDGARELSDIVVCLLC